MTVARTNSVPGPADTVTAERRVRLQLEGLVQGVGFRPSIHRLASSLGLNGWVANSSLGVTIDIEGAGQAVDVFLGRLNAQLPPLARVDRMQTDEMPLAGYEAFRICESTSEAERTALVLPDIATCGDCRSEISDPANRRCLYPFTNCTNCGPRFSILKALPYDRVNTTMNQFEMCTACRAEFENPADRRFHAQPNACPDCGPQLALLDAGGAKLAERHDALLSAVEALRRGEILALKGLGGFQLLVDARNDKAIAELRRRKVRSEKPFALMAPSLTFIETVCHVSKIERELLTTPFAPIVLLKRRVPPIKENRLPVELIAPANRMFGFMLPYTPLHHLLMREFGSPVIATSGNHSNEPITTDDTEALDRLKHIADLYLTHDRPIACALDDSVVRVMARRPLVLRRARGYAPLSLELNRNVPAMLALGGHLKSAAAVTSGSHIVLGPHVGDLDTAIARKAHQVTIDRLQGLYSSDPVAIACDYHPDYHTTHMAKRSDVKVVEVQHHIAHIAACIAENDVEGPVLGVAWDGTGYGSDGTIWGGEFIVVDDASARRAAHLLPFRLPGGEKAVSEPRRAAIGVLFELLGEAALDNDQSEPNRSFSETERRILARMLAANLNAPYTTSIGRLFDATASILGLVQKTSFEGQAPMALEFALDQHPPLKRYALAIEPRSAFSDRPLVLDWRPMMQALLDDIAAGAPISDMVAAFHNGLIDAIIVVARHVGETRVVLTGGCFQNRYLTEAAVKRLVQQGFEPFWHQHVPPNDGGLALGQAVWAARLLESGVA